jgi:YidC/Oxa1 family membrane protein insertase
VDRNLLIAFALSFIVLASWSSLQRRQQEAYEAAGSGGVEATAPAAAPEAARAERHPALPAALPPPAEPAAATSEEAAPGRRVELKTPLYRVVLNARGGAIEHWELTKYVDRYGEPVVVVDAATGAGRVAETPFLGLGLGDLSRALWKVDEVGPDDVTFVFEKKGVRIRKAYRFDRETYAFRLFVEVENQSDQALEARFAVDWAARVRTDNDFKDQMLALLHNGSVKQRPVASLGSPGLFGSLLGKQPVTTYEPFLGDVDWAGVKTPYFLAALVPDTPSGADARMLVLERSKAGAVELFFDPVRIPAGQRVAHEFRGYVGPKERARLEAMGGGLDSAIDIGWKWIAPLTHLFSWLLAVLYSVIPNYGVAIILLTILVRTVTAPLTIKQMRSMERMRVMQPRVKEIQEKYADDRPKQSEEMMRLWKQEGANPLSGCFPMLLQFPVFIGLYWALRGSIELRQAPFVGWIDDLSAPDELFVIPGLGIPFRVLPLVMGATMVLQQKITPMQANPEQARIMMTVMPVMMTVVFYRFPSGLVLYWMLSSMLAIGHQLWIGRKIRTPA